VQYRTDANLAARQSIYAYQHPPIDLPARILDIAAPGPQDVVADVGCGNGAYLGELARRGHAGRVIGADLSLGLNGADHMRELRAIVAAAGGSGAGERIRLDDGEALLRTVFPSVTRHDFIGELRVPDPEPVAAYVRSLSGTQAAADPGRHVSAVLAMLPNDPGGPFRPFHITTHAGCLVCA
jgi:SAM-dependent methyltransferase